MRQNPFDVANRNMFRAWRKAGESMGEPLQAAEPPPIDDLFDQMSVNAANALARKVGGAKVARWFVYMREKRGGQW
jgi:hypothetical protein